MQDSTESEALEPIVAQMKLRSAHLIRCLGDGHVQRFILEDVSSRKRRQFDDLQSLLAHLNDVLATGED